MSIEVVGEIIPAMEVDDMERELQTTSTNLNKLVKPDVKPDLPQLPRIVPQITC